MQTDKAVHASRYVWVWAAVIAAVALAARLVAGPRTVDDAYITFRYARNLAMGLGFVYNPGQHVLGTTTPLYTGLMALAWTLGLHDLPAVALAVNALADAATAALLYWLALRLEAGRIVALGLGLAWAVSPMSVTFAIGGMETSAVILFLAGSFAAYVVGRSRLSAALMALAVLTRPDALIAAGLLFADMALRSLLAHDGAPLVTRLRRLPWAEAAIFVGILVPWIAFAAAYFGSPLPQSVQAKVRAYQLDPLSALIRLLQHFSTPFFEHRVLGRFWPAVGLPLYLFLYVAGALRLIRHTARTLPLLLYPLVYVAVFSAANVLVFRWYLAPPLPFYFLGILVGLGAITTIVAQALGRSRIGAWATTVVAAALLLSSLSEYTLHPDHGPNRPAPEMAWFKLELLYRQAAEGIRPDLKPGDVVAAADIGAVGWFSEAPILDTLGLISPEAVPYYPLDPSLLAIQYAVSPDLVRTQRPKYLITLEVYVRRSLLAAPWFGESYRLVRKLDTDIYGSDGMLVFERLP
jgi:arabinofuranosyltransferase